MHSFTRLLLVALVVGSARPASAQVANYTVERQRWLTQLSTNSIPAAYRFGARVVGVNLLKAEVRLPGTTNVLAGGASLMTFATNLPALTIEGTNLVDALPAFEAAYPVGTYALYDEYKLLTTRSQLFVSQVANSFAVPDPTITNLTPAMYLQATQTFRWPVFTSDTNCYCNFYLLEGDTDTNMIDVLINSGIDALTNSLSVLAWRRNLSPLENAVTVTNLDPTLDHVALVEFHNVNAVTPALPPGEISSVSANAVFFFGLKILADPVSQTVEEGDVAVFSVLAVGAQPMAYQWKFNGADIPGATTRLHYIATVTTNHAGEYTVVVTNPAGSQTSAKAILTVVPPSQPPTFSLEDAAAVTTGPMAGAFTFRVVTGVPATNLIETWTTPGQWQVIGQLPTPTGSAYFVDTNALTQYPYRFYRARQ
jgi:hypothetical protein